ncbi:MAG: GAF domain-containing protein [Bacteroidota bacterium]
MKYIQQYSYSGNLTNTDLPFVVKGNFEAMFKYWESLANSDIPGEKERGQAVLDRLASAPELRTSNVDIKILEKYEEEVRLLFSPIFSPLTTLNEIKALAMPFEPIFFNMTERMSNIVKDAGGGQQVKMRFISEDLLYINACIFVLNFKYGAGINFSKPVFFDIVNKTTGVNRHYRAFFNADFASFKANPSFTPLTKEDIEELKNNFDNVDIWKEKIPPGSFEYEGFGLISLFDVTREEAVSALKVDLLKREALQSPEIIGRLEENISSLLNVSNLKLGFAAFDEDRGLLKPLGFGFWNSITLTEKTSQKSCDVFCEFSNEHIFKKNQPIAIPSFDPAQFKNNPLLDKLVDNNVKSYIAIPLKYGDEIIGVLELGSEIPNTLNSVTLNMLDEVVPLVTTAMKRSLDEHETQLEAIIQEKCTNIHPSVSWRFFEAAENLLEKQHYSDENELEDIVFPDVYPLFGQTDIKGSSTARNESIQADMVHQLTEAKQVLDLAMRKTPLPIYQELKFRISKYIKKMKKGLGAGDEITVLEFLKREIYPVFNHLESLGGDAQEAVEAYNAMLDPELHVIYDKRKDYEDSVAQINETMSKYIDKAQDSAQEMFPHYFEKYKTDGVEHNIYIGQSMVSNRDFNQVYLQNLRLWQLMMLCEVENELHWQRPTLKVPLGVCSLVLIHSNPLTIRFRKEEKQFDVDGAYNVRYEIIKKRIDKAYIKGTEERLTQPGKIAIVYSQEREAREYRRYLEYLRSINYIGPEIEDLDLNDMQGVTGMKALRVSVVFSKKVKGIKASKAVELVKS